MPWSGGPRRGGWGPPKWWGPYPHGHMYYRRRRWGLRRRLTFAFVFVALAAVTLTTWFTLGAVFDAQRDLFQTDGTVGTSHQPGEEPGFAAAREAFGRVTRTAFWAGVVSFFLASGAAVGVTRVLTRPLIALTDGARRLEAGERGIRLEPPTARDELRGLTEAFNNLVAGLERQASWRRALVADYRPRPAHAAVGHAQRDRSDAGWAGGRRRGGAGLPPWRSHAAVAPGRRSPHPVVG